MKIEDTLLGFIEYEGKKSPFVYENGILQLLPASEDEWKENRRELFRNFGKGWLSAKNEWIGQSLIYGKMHDGSSIVFSVSNLCSNNNGFKSFSVLYLMKYDTENLKPNMIHGISVSGREVNYFYTSSKAFETSFSVSNDGFRRANVSTGAQQECVLGSYIYNGCKITVTANLVPQIAWESDTPLTAYSKLQLSFSEPQNIEFVIAIYEHVLRLFYYVCGRTNISLDDVGIYGLLDEKETELGVLRFAEVDCNEETDEKRSKQIIKYELLGPYTCVILQEIADNKLYFQHYRSSIRAKHSYGIDRIILNFTAFEQEERNIYPAEQVRSTEYMEAKEKSLQALESLKTELTGKRKKYVKGFIDSISKAENKYADRMKKALEDCKDILKPFLIHDYMGYSEETSDSMLEEIAERMNDLRNNVVHGNLGMTIEAINVSDFSTLENLLYAMRFKKMGLNYLSIQKAICSVRGYNIYISDEIVQAKTLE